MEKMELGWRTAGGGRKKVGGQVNNGIESLLSERQKAWPTSAALSSLTQLSEIETNILHFLSLI